ncbi:uncharacterized protein [Panulirus ornatus]|uniref:uncharacterized protein isoform X1 n=1 Tax=Panulirus ornatus TaxID=150431 RepID=UPI003A87502B
MGADEQQQQSKPGNEAPKKESSAVVKKAVKVVTVMAYASGVSSAGVLLSLYYIFFWDPRITGVKPPGYLQSGEMMGMPESRVAMPEALKAEEPVAHPHKMSREFMEAFLNNHTEDELRASDDIDRQPTPRVLPLVKESFEVAAPAAHLTPTHPIPGDDPSTAQGDSPVGQPSKHYPLMSFSTHQQQQHQQDQYHQQQRQIQQQQQQQLEPLIALA